MKVLLEELGVDTRRIGLKFISAGEGIEFQKTVNNFIDQVRQLGPAKHGQKE